MCLAADAARSHRLGEYAAVLSPKFGKLPPHRCAPNVRVRLCV